MINQDLVLRDKYLAVELNAPLVEVGARAPPAAAQRVHAAAFLVGDNCCAAALPAVCSELQK